MQRLFQSLILGCNITAILCGIVLGFALGSLFQCELNKQDLELRATQLFEQLTADRMEPTVADPR